MERERKTNNKCASTIKVAKHNSITLQESGEDYNSHFLEKRKNQEKGGENWTRRQQREGKKNQSL